MGLRQLYFLLGGLLKRLVFLSMGLAVILAFIGVKLILEAVHENQYPFMGHRERLESVPAIPTWLSLTVILVVLLVATVASLLKTRGEQPRAASTEPTEDEAVGDEVAGHEVAGDEAAQTSEGAAPVPDAVDDPQRR